MESNERIMKSTHLLVVLHSRSIYYAIISIISSLSLVVFLLVQDRYLQFIPNTNFKTMTTSPKIYQPGCVQEVSQIYLYSIYHRRPKSHDPDGKG